MCSVKWKEALCLPAPLSGLSIKIILAQHTHSISVHCHEGGSKYPNHIGKTHLILWLVLYHPAGITDQLTRANMKCEPLMASFLEINTCYSPEGACFWLTPNRLLTVHNEHQISIVLLLVLVWLLYIQGSIYSRQCLIECSSTYAQPLHHVFMDAWM